MKIITTITVSMQRPDGSFSEITEQRSDDFGDNPSFDRSSAESAMIRTQAEVMKRIR